MQTNKNKRKGNDGQGLNLEDLYSKVDKNTGDLVSNSAQLENIAKKQKIYKNNNVLYPKIIHSFKNTSAFTTSGCTIDQDTTNFLSGTYGLRATSTVAGNTAALWSPNSLTIDLSDATDFELKVYIPDITKTVSVYLYLYSANGNYNAIKDAVISGWNVFRFSKSEFGIVGTVNWADIFNQVCVRFMSASGQMGTCTIEYIKKNVVDIPQVIFTFDDAFTSAYTVAMPYLRSKGLVGNIAPYSGIVDTTNHMTLAQLQEVYSYGWDIMNHSTTHPDFSALTYTQVCDEIQSMQNYLLTNGFTRANDIMIYPVNYSDMGKQVAKDLGFVAARGLRGRINYAHPDDMFNLRSNVPGKTSVLSDFTPYIDKMLSTGGTYIFTIHDIVASPSGSNDVAITLFQGLVDYIVANNIKVVTYSQWYNSLF